MRRLRTVLLNIIYYIPIRKSRLPYNIML